MSLSAATRGTALEGQATRDIYESVSKAMATLGRSSEDTEGALLAISQMVSKGTVSMEELRGQLGERLPGAFQLAAKAMGVTTQELDAMISSGGVAATEFLPKLAQALKDILALAARIDAGQPTQTDRDTLASLPPFYESPEFLVRAVVYVYQLRWGGLHGNA